MTSNRSTATTATSLADSITTAFETKILTGMPVARQADMMDLGSLSVSDLHLLKKHDPFMYYSIPGATNPRAEQNLDLMLPSLATGTSRSNLMSDTEQDKPRNAPRNRLRSVSDSSLFVERRTRISYESNLNDVMESIIVEMAELHAQNSNCKMKRSASCSQVAQLQKEQDECRKPKSSSVSQDNLFSIFESIWEDECDEKESSD
ncbi:hypothetical protein ACHAW6_005989 [Cyclotella cf. meneghiniana]